MNRERLSSLVIAVLAVLALAVGAAVIDTPTRTAGTGGGSGGGSGGALGEGSTFSLGQPPADPPTLGDSPEIIYRLLIVALVVAFLVALYFQRNEIGLDDLRNVAVAVVILGVFSAIFYYILRSFFGNGNSSGQRGSVGRNASAVPGGGTGGASDTALQPVSTNLPLIALVVGFVLVVGVLLALRSKSEDEPTDGESEPSDTTTMEGVGRAAGRAADRITGETTVENEVYRAWHEMTTQLEMENPDSSTPGEFARAATDAGMSRRDVDELTELFRTVRYGDSTITTDRESRAVAALRRIEETYAEEP